MDTNVLNIKNISNTSLTIEAQFMKNSSDTETELKNSFSYSDIIFKVFRFATIVGKNQKIHIIFSPLSIFFYDCYTQE